MQLRSGVAVISTLALLAASSSSLAQPPPSATAAGFTALQVTTTNPTKFVADWAKPGPGAHLQTERRTERGRPISAFIIFKGCKPDPTGACDVAAHMKLTGPPGAQTGPEADIVVWPKRPPVQGYSRSLQAFTIRFTAADPPGAYSLASDVTDRVAGVTVHIEGPVTLDGG